MVLMPVYIRIFLMITHGFHWTSKHSFVESSVSNFRLESQLKSTLLLFYSSYWENSIEILHRRFIWLFLINCYTIHFVFIQSGLKRLFACISRNFPAFYQVFNWIEKKNDGGMAIFGDLFRPLNRLFGAIELSWFDAFNYILSTYRFVNAVARGDSNKKKPENQISRHKYSLLCWKISQLDMYAFMGSHNIWPTFNSIEDALINYFTMKTTYTRNYQFYTHKNLININNYESYWLYTASIFTMQIIMENLLILW